MSRLAVDVGGTKIAAALYADRDGGARPRAEVRLDTAAYRALDEALSTLLAEPRFAAVLAHERLEAAAIAVAAPLEGAVLRGPNLPWPIERAAVAGTLGLEPEALCWLNDVEAAAWALDRLGSAALCTLQRGRPDPLGPRVLLAVGTGLGTAAWVPGEGGLAPRVIAAEGGHVEFAPQCDEDVRLWSFLRARFDHVSVERVVGGAGWPELYAFVLEDAPALAARACLDPERLVRERALAAARIAAAARERRCPAALGVLAIWARALAAAAGNAALAWGATGGVVLGGGMPPRLLAVLSTPAFVQRYGAKGRLAAWVRRVPLAVIRKPQSLALRGAIAALESRRGRGRGV